MKNIEFKRTVSFILSLMIVFFAVPFRANGEEITENINLAKAPGAEKYFAAVENELIDPESRNTVLSTVGDGGAYISRGIYSENGFDADSANGAAGIHIAVTRKEKINTDGSVAFVLKTVSEEKTLTLEARLIADETTVYSAQIDANSVYAAFLPMDDSGNTMFSGIEIRIVSTSGKAVSFTVSDISYSRTYGIADSVKYLTCDYSVSGGKLEIEENAVFILNGSRGTLTSSPLNYLIDGELNGVKVSLNNAAEAKKLTFTYRIGKASYSETTEMISGDGTYRFALEQSRNGDILSDVSFGFSSGEKGNIVMYDISLVHFEAAREPACDAVYSENVLTLSGKIPKGTEAEYVEIFKTSDGTVTPDSYSCGKLPITDTYTFTLYGEASLYYGYVPVLVGDEIFEPIGDAVYPAVPPDMGKDVPTASVNGKKGLVCADGSLIEELNVKQVYVTLSADELITADQTKNAFSAGEKIYYVSQAALDNADHVIRTANAADTVVSLKLTYSKVSIEMYVHLAAFLAQRYSDEKNGTVSAYVIGDGLNIKGDCEKNVALVSLTRNAVLSKNKNAKILLSAACGDGMIVPDDFIYSMTKLCGFEPGASITVNGKECEKHIADISNLSGVGVDVLIDGKSTEAASVAEFADAFYRYSCLEAVSAVLLMRQNDSDGKIGLYKVNIDESSVSTLPRDAFCDVYRYIDTSRGAELTGKYTSLEPHQTVIYEFSETDVYIDKVSIEEDLILQSTVCSPDDHKLWSLGGGATSVSQATVTEKRAVSLTFDLSLHTYGMAVFKPTESPVSEQGYCLLLYADYLPPETEGVDIRIYADDGKDRYVGQCEITAGKACEVYIDVSSFDSLTFEIKGERISPRISVFGIYSCKKRAFQPVLEETLSPETEQAEPVAEGGALGKTLVITSAAVIAVISGTGIYLYVKKRSGKGNM